MVTIYIDNKPYEVTSGQNLLQACLSLGFDLPYFCWHPALHAVGACRQCAVKIYKDEKDTHGRIVMACMTPVASGMRISVDDPEARAFRSSVIEWLMLNHPHDCPICDEGGECHLQDMTVMTGHNYRRTRFPKRTHRNQDLGPFINHEMNRCIQCYRCLRFYRDYAGGRDFHAFASHDHVYFGRYEDGTLESEFSGNLTEVCPTGVFTDKTLKQHYTRKWDLQTAPSLCVHCGIGCNTIPGERYGSVRRILNRFNSDVNGYFLCDRGRFGYEFVNSGRRIKKALLLERGQHSQRPVDKSIALRSVVDLLAKSKGTIGIGSPRASLESNFALRLLVGPDNFYAGVSNADKTLIATMLDILAKGPAHSTSLHEVTQADAVLVLGEDVTNTAPLLDLALRQAVRRKSIDLAATLKVPEWDDSAVHNAAQEDRSPLFIATVLGTKLDGIATNVYHAAPHALARLGFAIAHELTAEVPPVSNLEDTAHTLAKKIAAALGNAKRPVIVSGASLGVASLVQAAANVAWALCARGQSAGLCYTVPESNSIGAGLINGKSLDEAFKTIQRNEADTVIIVENDLYRRATESTVTAFLRGAQRVIVIDHLFNSTSSKADITLAAGTYAESTGTIVSNEGRAQRHYPVVHPDHDVQESWKWIRDIIKASGRTDGAWQNFDDIIADVSSTLPIFEPLRELAPPADFRISNMKIPRQPHRYSGRTAMLAHIDVHEPKPPDDDDSPLAFSMEGYEGKPPSQLISRYWSPGWNSVQALNKFQQEVGGPLRGGDPGKRLLEPSSSRSAPYFRNIPEPFAARAGEWLVVPQHHIFGSEELSLLASGIAHRAPNPYIALCAGDASRLNMTHGEMAALYVDDVKHDLEVIIFPDLPPGVAGLPASLCVTLGVDSPRYVRIAKGS